MPPSRDKKCDYMYNCKFVTICVTIKKLLLPLSKEDTPSLNSTKFLLKYYSLCPKNTPSFEQHEIFIIQEYVKWREYKVILEKIKKRYFYF